MRRKTKRSMSAVLIFLGVFSSGVAMAQEQDEEKEKFFEGSSDGWHWYEDPPAEIVEEEEKPKESVEAAGSSAKGPEPLSTEWLREMLPKFRDTAIDNPTEENVAAYYYVQRIVMDKAQVFSDVAKTVVENDPLLDENLRLPFASAAKVSVLKEANVAKKEIINGLSEKAALWVFYDDTCSYCEQQIAPLNKFAEEHDIKVELIHKQGGTVGGLSKKIDNRKAAGQFETIGINFTPSVVMVYPPNDLWIISQGFTSYTQLVDRVIAAGNRFGIIDESDYRRAVPTSNGVLRADRLEHEEVDWENPEELVPFLRKSIGETYGISPNEESGGE